MVVIRTLADLYPTPTPTPTLVDVPDYCTASRARSGLDLEERDSSPACINLGVRAPLAGSLASARA
jgi:hypothetical protein